MEHLSKERYVQYMVGKIIGQVLEAFQRGEDSYTHIFPESIRYYEEIVEEIKKRFIDCKILLFDRAARVRFMTGRELTIIWNDDE